MSNSKIGTQLGKAKKFSNFRCVRCHSYLLPLTEEKMDLDTPLDCANCGYAEECYEETFGDYL